MALSIATRHPRYSLILLKETDKKNPNNNGNSGRKNLLVCFIVKEVRHVRAAKEVGLERETLEMVS